MDILELSPQEAFEKLQNNDALIFDLRQFEDFEKEHIKDALFLDLDHWQILLKPVRDQKIILACYRGNKSRKAVLFLKENGFEHVFNLQGGFNGWKEAGLPMD